MTVTFLDQRWSVGGGFMVSHGFWLVSMVFQVSFMVSHGLGLVSMVFQVTFMVSHGFAIFCEHCKPRQSLQVSDGTSTTSAAKCKCKQLTAKSPMAGGSNALF